ncbi:hypothetical protein BYT27DRAFT_7219063 [Phlegmacium glaucopus]|nr:hypothetical protein BYT27DRAFT_7219063 [Phlegmacium glaucopus]
MEVRRSSRVASRPPSAQLPTVPGSFIVAPPGTRKTAGYVYEILPSIADASPSLPDHHSGPPDPPGTADDFRDVSLPQTNLVPASGGFVGRKRAATSEVPHSPRRGRGPVEPLHAFPAAQGLTSPHRTSSYAVPDLPAHPATPARSIRSNRTAPPASSPIASNPLLHCPVAASAHTPSPGRSRSLSLRTRDSHAAWAAAEGLLPIPDAFKTPGYVPAHIVGGITYDIRAPRLQQPKPAGPAIMPDHLFTPSGSSRHPSEQRGSRLAPAISAIPSLHARNFASHSHVPGPVQVHTNDSDPRSPSFANRPPGSGDREALRVSASARLPSPSNTIHSSRLRELTRQQFLQHALPHAHGVPSPSLGAHPAIDADLVAAIAAALRTTSSQLPSNMLQSTRKFFSQTITNATSELPIAVIKELKSGFKNYIPLSLCTHKACSYATRSSDAFDTEIGMNDRGEIRLKQKTLTASKDHYLSTDDFTEIRENFTRGMKKYLILGDDTEPAGERALECASMFHEFFSTIASRPDFTQDWPSYRGYIIESYTSWIGRRDDSFGLIFDEHLFHKFKLKNLVPSLLEQLRQTPSIPAGFSGHRSHNSFSGGGGPATRGRGRGSSGSQFSNPHRSAYPQSFLGHSSGSNFKCYLCGDPHSYRDHQGAAKRLVTNEHGKWIDRLLGNKIVLSTSSLCL